MFAAKDLWISLLWTRKGSSLIGVEDFLYGVSRKLNHKALAVEAVNKTMFLSHLEHQGKTVAGKSDMNPCHFSPVFLLKELEEAPRYGSLVYDNICKGGEHSCTHNHQYSQFPWGCQSTLHQLMGARRETWPTLDSSHPKVKCGDVLPASFQTHFPCWSTRNLTPTTQLREKQPANTAPR